MKFDNNIAVGVKFYIGDLEDSDDRDLSDFTFKFCSEDDELLDEIDDPSGVFSGRNKMNCKFFDKDSGTLYVHFDKEVIREDLFMFEDTEMIYKKINT